MKKICVITDNEFLYGKLKRIIEGAEYSGYQFDFYYSENNKAFQNKYKGCESFQPINLKAMEDSFYRQYHVFLSLHCKQMFPEKLVGCYRCINVHPGYNPYNRGWFPQVFSILNKKPAGVTIHEMDRELDHGPVICQEYVEIQPYDTSWDVYQRIQQKEADMLEVYLANLLEGNYNRSAMPMEGNVNSKADFEKLCKIDLGRAATYGEVIDFLRATTFDAYDNAYFLDQDGNRVYVSISLKREAGSGK